VCHGHGIYYGMQYCAYFIWFLWILIVFSVQLSLQCLGPLFRSKLMLPIKFGEYLI
jgi:hypothetical protein